MSLFIKTNSKKSSNENGTPKEIHEKQIKQLKFRFSIYLLVSQLITIVFFGMPEPQAQKPISREISGYKGLRVQAKVMVPRPEQGKASVSIYLKGGQFLSHGFIVRGNWSTDGEQDLVTIEVPEEKLPLFINRKDKVLLIYPKVGRVTTIKRGTYEISI